MFVVKIHNDKKNRDDIFSKTIDNIKGFITNKLNFKESRIATDNSCVEIVSGNTDKFNTEDKIIAELTIKKSFVINNSDFDDRDKLDEFIHKIKHFCEQAKSIEEDKYVKFHLRKGSD